MTGAKERHNPRTISFLVHDTTAGTAVSCILRSLRTSSLPLYLDALQKLTPWFFALDHMDYSRWVPVHLYDMLTLKKRLPQTYAHLLNGGFTVQKTAKAFSAIAIDQAHEQNNGMVKGDGGAVGLTENPAALRRWMISDPEVARLIAEFEASPEADEEIKPGSIRHHEEAKSTQLSFAKDVKSLTSVIDDMGNPFTEESGDILVLDTKDHI